MVDLHDTMVDHPDRIGDLFFNVFIQVPSTITFKGGLIRFHTSFISVYILNISHTSTLTVPFPIILCSFRV